MPAAIRVMNPAPANCWKNGGTRQCSSAASNRSTMSPVKNVARMIFHDVVNSSDTPALTPAFPIIAAHCGYRWAHGCDRKPRGFADWETASELFGQLAHLTYLAVINVMRLHHSDA